MNFVQKTELFEVLSRLLTETLRIMTLNSIKIISLWCANGLIGQSD
jgi:hypothetical protein